jgi:uncharacterized protein (TIGR03067 family)
MGQRCKNGESVMHWEGKVQMNGDTDFISDMGRIQGAWIRTVAYLAGESNRSAEGVVEYFEGDCFRWCLSERGLASKNFRFRLNEEADPKQIDLISDEGVDLGIYRFNEDGTLTMCFFEDSVMQRPTEFKSSSTNKTTLSIKERVLDPE